VLSRVVGVDADGSTEESLRRVSRSNVVVLSLLVTSAAMSIEACAKKPKGSPQADPKYIAASQSLQRFNDDAQKLQAETAAIRKRLERVDASAGDLPGLAAFRLDLFAAEEILGGVGGTSDWLSRELDAAFASGDGQQIETITATIARSADDMKNFGKTVVHLSHDLMRFERSVTQFRTLAAAGVFFTRVLPTGYEVKAANNGIEQRLLNVVGDRKNAVRASWLVFDRVWFAADGAGLDISVSSEQLDNVAAILKAYPNVKLEIAGYDDDAAPAAAAKKLAPARAEAVKHHLVSLGVAEAQLKTAGHGRAQARCAAKDVKECRAKQPRIAARVVAL
jgi:outer membrane protein OmpA-like peptidoglycan-associated protein